VPTMASLGEIREMRRAAAAPDEQTEVTLGADTLLVLAAVAAASLGQGAYYRRVAELCGLLLVAAAVVLLGTRARSRQAWRSTNWALGGVGLLAGCIGLAGILDGHPAGAIPPVALLAGLAVIAAAVASLNAPSRRQLADVIVGLGVFLAGTAWVGVAFHLQPLGHPDGGLWRAATTLTYANAAAAFLAPLALWALARNAVHGSKAGRLALVMLVTGLGATLSRAGLGSFAVGVVVLVVLLGFRAAWRGGGPALLGGLIATGGLIPGMPASGPTRPAWAVLGLAAGLALGAARWPRSLDPSGVPRPRRRRRIRFAAIGVLALASFGLALGLASHSRLWSGRLSLSSPDRASAASAALHLWRTHLVSGVGPGRAIFIWTAADHQVVYDRYAHDEYLQIAAEDGVVGLVGLALLGAGVAVTARRGWRSSSRPLAGVEPDADLKALRAGVMAGLVCFALHSGFDFLWHLPVLPMIAAVAVGLVAPTAGSGPMSQTQMSQPQMSQPNTQEVQCSTRKAQ